MMGSALATLQFCVQAKPVIPLSEQGFVLTIYAVAGVEGSLRRRGGTPLARNTSGSKLFFSLVLFSMCLLASVS